jgi:type IX secretion system PorP/SprF family membrane protein
MKKIIITAILISSMLTAAAQQLHFTSLYQQHNSMYNPAAAGMSDNKAILGMSYRSMWSTFPGNPKTFMVYADADWNKMNAGIAGYIYRDVTGPTSRTGMQLAYSYHIKTGADEKRKLGLGLELRTVQFAIDKAKLQDALANDPVLSGADSKLKLDAGAGVYYTNGKLSAGAAVMQLIQSKLSLAEVNNATLRARLYRHYNFTVNYMFNTGEDIYVIPNAMVRMIEHSPTEYEFGCKVDYQDKIWWNLLMRVKQFWSAQIGFKLFKKVGLGYCYDYYVTPLSQFTDKYHSHEFSFRFDLK